MKGIIFDVDGTLWDSTEMVAVAWNKVIKDEGIEHKELEEKDLKKEFGKPMEASLLTVPGPIIQKSVKG